MFVTPAPSTKTDIIKWVTELKKQQKMQIDRQRANFVLRLFSYVPKAGRNDPYLFGAKKPDRLPLKSKNVAG